MHTRALSCIDNNPSLPLLTNLSPAQAVLSQDCVNVPNAREVQMETGKWRKKKCNKEEQNTAQKK